MPSRVDAVAALAEVLDAEERERAARFAFDKDRHLFIVAHALLRYGLRRVSTVSRWRFRVDRYGKPELVLPPGSAALRFNLSHSRALAACAFSVGHDVGIDVEGVDRVFDFDGIAASHFAPSEQAQLAACEGPRRADAFYRLWTLKEAIIKAIGHGLSLKLQDFAFTLEPLSLSIASHQAHDARDWHIEQRKITPAHWAALAVRRPPGMPLTVEWRSTDAAEILAGLRSDDGERTTEDG